MLDRTQQRSLWLARHGSSKGVDEGRYGGAADFALSESGCAQATMLRAEAERLSIDVVVTSPLLRARQTAEIIANDVRKLIILDDLQEWNSYGVLSGLTAQEALQLFPELMRDVDGKPEYNKGSILGGEDIVDFRIRAERALTCILEISKPPRRCLVVMHGKFLQELATNIIRADGAPSYRSASLCLLSFRPARGALVRLGATPEITDGDRSMKIYVVRHGEAADDLNDSYGGAADHALTEKGEDQARDIANALRDSGIEAIYTSPLRRASKTAEILSRELGLTKTVTLTDLQERNSYGVLSGIPKSKAWELFPLLLKEGEKRSGHSKAPMLGAEDYDAFVSRVRAAFQLVVDDATANGCQRIAIVTHGTFLRILIADCLRLVFPEDWKHGSAMLLDYHLQQASISPL